MWRRVLSERPVTVSEGLVCAALLVALCSAMYGSYVFEGGFHSDDWANAADYRFGDAPRLLSLAEQHMRQAGSRPLHGLVLGSPHALFGLATELHIGSVLLIAVAVSVCLFLVLRTVGLEPIHAGAIAALVLLFPWSDANRFWATDGFHNVAVLFYLLGTLCALRAIGSTGRASILFHIGATALYLISVLIYESPLVVMLASPLIYIWKAPLNRVLRRWGIDLVAVGAAFLFVALTTERDNPGLMLLLKAPLRFGREGFAVLGATIFPVGGSASISAVALILLTGVLAVAWWRVPREQIDQAQRRRWLLIGAAAALFIVAAHAVYFGTALLPLNDGQENRGNIIAGIGYVTLGYSVLMMTNTLLLRGARVRWQGRATPLWSVAVLLVGIGYSVQVLSHKAQWERASNFADQVLEVVRRSVPEPPRGSTIYTFHHPRQVSSGIPVFSETWDLKGALQVTYDDETIRGYPIYEGTRFVCGQSILYPARDTPPDDFDGQGYGPDQREAYGRAIFVDVSTSRARMIDSRADCLAARASFRPGGLTLE
jgi:hypothetical protein